MRRSIAPTWPLLVLCCLSPRAAIAFQVLLEVDLPSGTASAVFTDGDADGVIDFDVTVGGAFLAKGEVKQGSNPSIQSLTIAPPPPPPPSHPHHPPSQRPSESWPGPAERPGPRSPPMLAPRRSSLLWAGTSSTTRPSTRPCRASRTGRAIPSRAG